MYKLDARNIPCPQPVIACRNMLLQHNPDQLTVTVDNEAAKENVTRFLEQKNYKVLHSQEDKDFIITAKKCDDAIQENTLQNNNTAPQDTVYLQPQEQEKVVAFITTETLGRGDDDLGKKLMITFLETLEEFGEKLWRVILLNGGVKLATHVNASENTAHELSLSLKALQKLESHGAKVLVCGTCLAHYGLMEQKGIGETSNMLDIMTSLELADKIIRP